MPKKKQHKVTLFLHHRISQTFDAEHKEQDISASTIHDQVKKGLGFFAILEAICFGVGLGIVRAIVFGYKAIKTFIASTIDSAVFFTKALAIKEVRRAAAVFAVFALVGTAALQMGPIASQALELKGRVLGVADSGIASLGDAQKLLEQEQIGSAQGKFVQALQNFNQSTQELKEAGVVFNGVGDLFPQKRQGEAMLAAAKNISQAGVEFTQSYSMFGQLKFSAQGIETKDGANNKDALLFIEQKMTSGLTHIEEAHRALENVSDGSIPSKYLEQFTKAKTQLASIASSLGAFKDLVAISNQLLLGQKEVLLLLQNNNELRPTGGFIGTYGAMKLSDGKINALHISSVYDLDGQLKDKIIPPHPLYAINNRWYLRDSNWFADFPESAKIITSFYEKEGGESPDLIIALTPTLVTELLTVTGPIQLPKYGVTLTSDNFVELTQIATSVSYDKLENKPKQLLADFFPVLLQKLSDFDSKQYLHIAELFQKSLSSKDILLYSRDEALQSRLSAYNWTGSIRNSDRDYLSLVSANLSATKTDIYIKQKVSLHSEISNEGQIKNTLTITRTNPLPAGDDYTNTSFIRIFVPQGAKLESSEGFTFKPLEVPPLSDAKPYDAVEQWEQRLLKNVVSGTMIGEEAGKTFFANWMELKGGESKTATISYTLPITLNDTDRYSLLVQKQPGAQAYDFSYSLSYPNHSLVWKNNALSTVESHSLTAQLPLNQDRFLGLVLKK
jgi:hypothetical protein